MGVYRISQYTVDLAYSESFYNKVQDVNTSEPHVGGAIMASLMPVAPPTGVHVALKSLHPVLRCKRKPNPPLCDYV